MNDVERTKKKNAYLVAGCAGAVLLMWGVIALGLWLWATSPLSPSEQPCRQHVELKSAAWWARELGQSETEVRASHRINLWERLGGNRGKVVGHLRPGSQAVILEERDDSYRVRSPADRSVGWVSAVQVERVLWRNVKTRASCAP